MSIEGGAAYPAPRAELIFAVVLLIGAGSLLVQATTLPFFSEDGTIGPGFFATSLSALVVAALIGYVAMILHAGARNGWQPDATERLVSVAQAELVGLIIAAMILGPWIGIVGAVGIVLLVGLLVVDRVRPLQAVLVTLGTLAVIVVVFGVWLRMDLGFELPF